MGSEDLLPFRCADILASVVYMVWNYLDNYGHTLVAYLVEVYSGFSLDGVGCVPQALDYR